MKFHPFFIVLFILFFAVILTLARTKHPVKPTNTQSQADNTKTSEDNTRPIPPQFPDKTFFLSAIRQNPYAAATTTIFGITVPHHLLAANLIAKAFAFAANQQPETVLLISPDHYFLGKTDVSISERNFLTVFGELQTDSKAVKKLEELKFVSNQDFFYREHGLGAELPFINYYFPKAKIIALTFKETTPKAELNKIIDVLKKTITAKTLIIQSTDFSHYLTPANAQTHDEQTTKILESGNADNLFHLVQPDNLDSTACQYLQTRLQNEVFGSKLKILFHKNSQDYTQEPLTSTTSYIIQAYLK